MTPNNQIIRKDVFGYFEDASETTPTHDPGLDVNCPICGKKLELPVKTISLMGIGKNGIRDNKSYFYRMHKDCYDNADPNVISEIEGSLIDNLEINKK